MNGLKRIVFSRTAFFVLFALAAAALMGATMEKSASRDLNRTALQLAKESSADVRSASDMLASRQPGVILRANVIGR